VDDVGDIDGDDMTAADEANDDGDDNGAPLLGTTEVATIVVGGVEGTIDGATVGEERVAVGSVIPDTVVLNNGRVVDVGGAIVALVVLITA
jgi:hypothetical protein